MVLLPLRPAWAKIPGEVHCYRSICHRVLTLDETKSLVGSTRVLVASYYDDPRVDPSNTGTLTSSGERFDADSSGRLASSLYPDGTELLLWNPLNGRTAHVRVNDFGPFHSNRMLDLTRGLAERLEITRRGVTKLHVTVVASPRAGEARYRRSRIYPRTKGYLGVYAQDALPGMASLLMEESQRRGLAELSKSGSSMRIALPERKPSLRARARDAIRGGGNPLRALAALPPLDAAGVVDAPRVAGSDLPPALLIAAADGETPAPVAEVRVERLMFAGTLNNAPRRVSTLDVALCLAAASIGMMMLHRVGRSSRRAMRAVARRRQGRELAVQTPMIALVRDEPALERRPLQSFVAAGIEITGSVASRNAVRIEGRLLGDCVAPRIVVEAAGSLEGNAVAEEIIVSGYVEGRIVARTVVLTDGAVIVGDVDYCELVVAPRATLEATVQRVEQEYWSDDALAEAA